MCNYSFFHSFPFFFLMFALGMMPTVMFSMYIKLQKIDQTITRIESGNCASCPVDPLDGALDGRQLDIDEADDES